MAHIKFLSLVYCTTNSWIDPCVYEDSFRSPFPLRDTAETKIGGCAVRSVLAPGCTSVSVTVRLKQGEIIHFLSNGNSFAKVYTSKLTENNHTATIVVHPPLYL